ncbi:MAG: hypothetical protein IIC87_02795 [Chloroflexi bacterium]|nr:hypothetical protein [Chloroflexota bacterium]
MFKALLLGLVVFSALIASQMNAPPALAAFHCMRIAALMGGAGGDANIQYVELRMNLGGQTLVSGHSITFRDAAGNLASTFTFTSNVTTGASGSSILIATQEFADNATVAPDFIFSGANTTGADVNHPIPTPSGKVSFAEGSGNCQIGGPSVVDSIAYGTGYTGSVDYGSKFPADLPNAGTQALVVNNLNLEPADNSSEYSIQTVPISIPPGANTPRNNAGATGSVTPPPPPADTDSDGLSDDDEINIHGTDPNNPDTDGDGLSDGAEVNVHGTDPLVSDTDDDGSNDFREVNMTTDPLEACPNNSSHDAWPFDTNKDKMVTILDLLGASASFKISFGSSDGEPNYNPRFDFNADGSVEIIDLLGTGKSFKTSFGKSCGNGTVRIDETGDGPFELTSAEEYHFTFDETFTPSSTWRVQVTAADASNISFKVTCPGLDEHAFDIAHSGGTNTITCNDGSKVEITIS